MPDATASSLFARLEMICPIVPHPGLGSVAGGAGWGWVAALALVAIVVLAAALARARRRADISAAEQRRAHEQLAAALKEAAYLRAALDEHAIVAITDPQGRITFVNDKFCAISQYTRDELVGQDHRIINSGHHSKAFIRELWTTIGQGRVWQGEIRNRAKDGSNYWVATTIVPFLDERGKPRQYVAIRADITALKRAEEALREANLDLEAKISERTAELRSAKERAESADRLKSEFLAAMSHELRTPLNSIIGFTEMLADERTGPLNERQGKYAQQVLGSGRHLLQLINDILDLSKIEAGRMELNLEIVSPAEVVTEVLTSLTPLAEKKRLLLRHTLDGDCRPCPLDRQKLKQILYNLVSNAVKFTPEGGTVGVDGRVNGAELMLCVHDTGIGIKPGDMSRLFTAFQQLDGGVARRYDGTGLGLALTRRLAELHGGRVTAASTPGVGSTFTVTIPLAAEAPRP